MRQAADNSFGTRGTWVPRALGLLAVLLLSGCGASDDAFVPVSGTVKFQGQALGGGLIVFTPDPEHGESGPVASARIGPDGSFRLKSTLGDGAMPGWHRVSVAAPVGRGDDPPTLALPRRYRQPDLSGLCREVVAGKENVFAFDLPMP